MRRSNTDRKNSPVHKSKRTWTNILVPLAIISLIAAGFLFFKYYLTSARKAYIKIDECSVMVEIADTPNLRKKGLSGRKRLQSVHGMLFVFDFQRRLSFWMKDTQIPLSVAFISSDGTILQIEDMEPYDLRLVTSDAAAKYALEVNKGFFQKNGITVGSHVGLRNIEK